MSASCKVQARSTGVVTNTFLVHFTLPRPSSMRNFMRERASDPCRSELEEGGSKRLSMPPCTPFRGSPSKSQGPSGAFELTKKQ
jgi:hypothetical protein